MTFDTFDQIDEDIWPDKKDNDKYKYILRAPPKINPSDKETWPDQKKDNDKDKDNDKYKYILRAPPKSDPNSDKDKWLSCDIWHSDYNYDNWEPEFMTIFVSWQLRVTLDSIRNSCDVCNATHATHSSNL